MVSAPDLAHTAAALHNLEHLVVIDPFLSETAERATVVLPGTTFGEIEGTITSLEGRVLRCDQAVPPAAGRSEVDVLRNLANRLGVGPWFRHTRGRDVFDELRRVCRPGGRWTTRASPGTGCATATACSGHAPARTTPARRCCTPRASAIPTVAHASSGSIRARHPSRPPPSGRWC
jgi:NADH dehydrogenase/NADH:ubiquinone oxidoreductase subunit G